jgi:protein-disulfide isomerase
MKRAPVYPCLAFLILSTTACFSQQPAAEKGSSAPRAEVLAVIDGKEITDKDLAIEGDLLQLRQKEYELRQEALDKVVERHLLAKEAAERGVSVDELKQQEILSKVSDPSEAEIEGFYEARKGRIGQPFEDVRDQIAAVLKEVQVRSAQEEFVATLRKKSAVEIYLAPPQVEVDLSRSPTRGPHDAPVTIVEFSDFQCPFCRRVQPVLRELSEKYGDQIRWSFKDLPLVSIHPEAQPAAEAARCAGDQGKFWEYRAALFEESRLNAELHQRISESLQLNPEEFQKCLSSQKYAEVVQADLAEAESLGINGTPAFVVNGVILSGAQPVEAFTRIIDRELAKLSRRGAADTSTQD